LEERKRGFLCNGDWEQQEYNKRYTRMNALDSSGWIGFQLILESDIAMT
jgi:hypothetical protein